MVVDVLFMTGLISLLLCILVILVWLHCFNYVDSEEEERKAKFKGICSRPEFAAAIRQSFASQTRTVVVAAAAGESQTGQDLQLQLSSCTTCALIAEGSSMAYSDHTCPQCGADTYHLTDPLKLIY